LLLRGEKQINFLNESEAFSSSDFGLFLRYDRERIRKLVLLSTYSISLSTISISKLRVGLHITEGRTTLLHLCVKERTEASGGGTVEVILLKEK
jgi:hypothetical protein